jgi:spermidine/putrescine transport system ATP-binding protein
MRRAEELASLTDMNASAIALRGLQKRFGTVTAVDSVNLEIATGEFFSLLGPSGCGKTTLLRLIAGFEQPDAGELDIGGQAMNGVPPRHRSVNTVFQNYALFPHLTVFENVAFGLKVRKTPAAELQKRVRETLQWLHVGDLQDRRPGEISGGQKQRVALARALAVRPKVLLLDEPLAAVDARRRAQVRDDLRRLQRATGTTFLYVTHDQDEALSLSDRVGVMDAGKIAQIGTPEEIYERPRNRFVASFMGRCNVIEGTVVRGQPDELLMKTAFGVLRLPPPTLPLNGDIAVAIRAERVVIGPPQKDNSFAAEVTNVTYTGALTEYSLTAHGQTLRAALTGNRPARLGDRVQARLPAEALVLLETT